MRALANQNIEGCKTHQTYADRQTEGILGCGSSFSYPYFLSYILLITLILINLFLAAVIGGYVESKKENEAAINPHQMEDFLDKWREYDP